ncbi:chromobox protein homolog 7 isoform X2 [Manacus candei]|uniref:chromobox protein homolog 7 isoform X2 n=1 Tax=Manacus candei TaxID=415023 RepID=UPI002227521D|nr:chromobox protein homolog 7 isoform X2 [Manacus candei]
MNLGHSLPLQGGSSQAHRCDAPAAGARPEEPSRVPAAALLPPPHRQPPLPQPPVAVFPRKAPANATAPLRRAALPHGAPAGCRRAEAGAAPQAPPAAASRTASLPPCLPPAPAPSRARRGKRCAGSKAAAGARPRARGRVRGSGGERPPPQTQPQAQPAAVPPAAWSCRPSGSRCSRWRASARSACGRYSTWEPEDHILDPRLVVAYEEKEERDRASGYRKRGPKPKRLLLQRLYGMDLRSAHKGKEKLCFSLARRFGGGDSSLPGAKTGQAEFPEKTGGAVLPFSLRKQRKNQKYLRLSRKKFPRMASLENRNCRHEFFLNDAVGLEARQGPEDWEAMQHTSKEDVDASLPWIPTVPPSEVTVTDITANSITVTFREAQVAEGFFRDRSAQF